MQKRVKSTLQSDPSVCFCGAQNWTHDLVHTKFSTMSYISKSHKYVNSLSYWNPTQTSISYAYEVSPCFFSRFRNLELEEDF